LASEEEVTITAAPIALAIWSAAIETPPGVDGFALTHAVRPAGAFTQAPRGWSPAESATITTAVGPMREEAGDDPVARDEVGDARTDRLDGAGPVRHQDATVLGRPGSRPQAVATGQEDRMKAFVVRQPGGLDRLEIASSGARWISIGRGRPQCAVAASTASARISSVSCAARIRRPMN
jgi:hypothetical protein